MLALQKVRPGSGIELRELPEVPDEAAPEQFPTAFEPRWETFDFRYAVTKPELLEARSVRLPPREELRALFRAS